MTAELNSRKAVPVTIGSTVIYCDDFRVTAVKSVSEAATASGLGVISNVFPRAAKLTISGRIYDEDNPMGAVISANAMLRSTLTLEIEYRGLKFTGCYVQSYDIRDPGKDYIEVSITLLTQQSITNSEVTA